MASKLYHGRVADASGKLCDIGTSQQIAACSVVNTTGSSANLTLWITPNSGTTGDTNVVYGPKAVAAGDTVSLTEIVALAISAGEEIHGLAGTVDTLTIRISGTA